MKKESNIILEKSLAFALRVLELYKYLKSKNEYELSKQLVRSGTSIGANVNEATAAHSKRDFINKMVIASKEARETKYWLILLDLSQLVEYEYKTYLNDADELVRILTAIVKSSQSGNSDIQN